MRPLAGAQRRTPAPWRPRLRQTPGPRRAAWLATAGLWRHNPCRVRLCPSPRTAHEPLVQPLGRSTPGHLGKCLNAICRQQLVLSFRETLEFDQARAKVLSFDSRHAGGPFRPTFSKAGERVAKQRFGFFAYPDRRTCRPRFVHHIKRIEVIAAEQLCGVVPARHRKKGSACVVLVLRMKHRGQVENSRGLQSGDCRQDADDGVQCASRR